MRGDLNLLNEQAKQSLCGKIWTTDSGVANWGSETQRGLTIIFFICVLWTHYNRLIMVLILEIQIIVLQHTGQTDNDFFVASLAEYNASRL